MPLVPTHVLVYYGQHNEIQYQGFDLKHTYTSCFHVLSSSNSIMNTKAGMMITAAHSRIDPLSIQHLLPSQW